MKLKTRIILSTTLICIISILSITIINYNMSIKNLEKEVSNRSQLENILISKDIDKWAALQKDSLDEIMEGLSSLIIMNMILYIII
ncbi:MAG: hypothetical protein GX214_04180 [Clostridiales bacterium]|nr:hypothetical protein [Clostridiales bacterium]